MGLRAFECAGGSRWSSPFVHAVFLDKAHMTPVKIRLGEDGRLIIEWDDGRICHYRLPVLRRNCPCAGCATDRRDRGEHYIPLYTKDALTLKNITPMGHYALQLSWKDGHDSGIYRFEFLRELCEDA